MKKVYNPIPDFYIPEKQCCFRVRVAVQTVEPGSQKQRNIQPYIYIVLSTKTTENPLRQ